LLRLSRNFRLSELTKSQTALRNGIINYPNTEQVASLEYLANRVLQPIRDWFEVPVTVSSGFRCLELNRKIGSSDTSQHAKGMAADIEIWGIDNYVLAEWIRDNLEFDQLILEFYDGSTPDSGWVHVSITEGHNRMECLTINKGTVKRGLVGKE
jgi:zinc D-Ala-D-Ala carboxypeptidase